MKIFPAIDIKGGKCVRLLKGDFDTSFVGIATKDIELKDLTKRVGVYYKEISTNDNVKFFDHTSAIFVINKESNLIGLYTPPVEINNIYEDIVNSFN